MGGLDTLLSAANSSSNTKADSYNTFENNVQLMSDILQGKTLKTLASSNLANIGEYLRNKQYTEVINGRSITRSLNFGNCWSQLVLASDLWSGYLRGANPRSAYRYMHAINILDRRLSFHDSSFDGGDKIATAMFWSFNENKDLLDILYGIVPERADLTSGNIYDKLEEYREKITAGSVNRELLYNYAYAVMRLINDTCVDASCKEVLIQAINLLLDSRYNKIKSIGADGWPHSEYYQKVCGNCIQKFDKWISILFTESNFEILAHPNKFTIIDCNYRIREWEPIVVDESDTSLTNHVKNIINTHTNCGVGRIEKLVCLRGHDMYDEYMRLGLNLEDFYCVQVEDESGLESCLYVWEITKEQFENTMGPMM